MAHIDRLAQMGQLEEAWTQAEEVSAHCAGRVLPRERWTRKMAQEAETHALAGDFEAAVPFILRDTLATLVAYGPQDPTYAWALANLGAHTDLVDQGAGLGYIEQAQAILDGRPEDGETEAALEALLGIGIFHLNRGSIDIALPALERGVQGRLKRSGPADPVLAVQRVALARAYTAAGMPERALAEYETAAAALDGSDLAVQYLGIAASGAGLRHLEMGRADLALPWLEKAAAIQEEEFGPHDASLALDLNNLAAAHGELGHATEAVALYERALALAESQREDGAVDPAYLRVQLAQAHLDLGDYATARGYVDEALALVHQEGGEAKAAALNVRGQLLHETGHLEEAYSSFQSAWEILREEAGRELDAASALGNIGLVLADMGRFDEARTILQQSLSEHELALGLAHPATSTVRANLGYLLNEMGQPHEARAELEHALDLALGNTAVSERTVAAIQTNLGIVLADLGEYDRALELYEHSLAIDRRLLGEQHPNVAKDLANIAALQAEDLGNYSIALPLARQALQIAAAAHGTAHPETARMMGNLGTIHHRLGEYQLAIDTLEQALAIESATLGDSHPTVANTLISLAEVHGDRGEYGVAVSLLERSLTIKESSRALSLHALIHQDLGQLEQAAEMYEQALRLEEEMYGPDYPNLPTHLNNLATLRSDMGDPEAALILAERSLAISEATYGAAHPKSATTRSNIGWYLMELGRVEDAESMVLSALNSHEAAQGPHHPHVAITVKQLYEIYLKLGRREEADASLRRAIGIALATEDVSTRWTVFLSASRDAEESGRIEEAILWGKLAIRSIERARGGARGVDASASSDFVGQYTRNYRHLARLLAERGRLAESEAVLSLLKTEEYSHFTRRDAGGGDLVPLSDREAEALSGFDQPRADLIANAQEYRELRGVAARRELTSSEEARLAELTGRRNRDRERIDATLDRLRADLASEARSEQWRSLALERTERLQRQLGDHPGSVLVHTVLLEKHLLLILTTSDAQLSITLPVSAAEVNRAIADFRLALMDPAADPRAAGQRLYDWLLRPLEEHLDQAEATTLLTYLDGTLRYAPIAALYDGEHFVAERYATAVYTPAAEADFRRPPTRDPYVAAFGASQAVTILDTPFAALPSIPGELDAVVRTAADDPGAVEGRLFLDDGFTARSLADALELGTPWVHIASHFRFAPGGTEADSFLVLGDGTPLSVADLRTGDFRFADVDLLALSACQTAMGEKRADGSEVEGLAVVAQDKGAAAVLATLWPVADASTAAWMATLYRGQATDPISRAAAVQRVQKAFLDGTIGPDKLPETVRGPRLVAPEPSTEPADHELDGWTHPFFWAPFVLYGTGA